MFIVTKRSLVNRHCDATRTALTVRGGGAVVVGYPGNGGVVHVVVVLGYCDHPPGTLRTPDTPLGYTGPYTGLHWTLHGLHWVYTGLHRVTTMAPLGHHRVIENMTILRISENF